MIPPEPISASSGWANTTMADSGTSATISSLRSVWSGMARSYPVRAPQGSRSVGVVQGGQRGRQGRQHLPEALPDARDVALGLLGDATAGDQGDELLAARRHQQGRVDLELDRVDAQRVGPAEGGHDVAAGVAAHVVVHLEAVAGEDRGAHLGETGRTGGPVAS